MTYFCTRPSPLSVFVRILLNLLPLADVRSRPKNRVLKAILKSTRTTTLGRPTPGTPLSQNVAKVGTTRPLRPAREGKKRKKSDAPRVKHGKALPDIAASPDACGISKVLGRVSRFLSRVDSFWGICSRKCGVPESFENSQLGRLPSDSNRV
jgi:hypothetical protein